MYIKCGGFTQLTFGINFSLVLFDNRFRDGQPKSITAFFACPGSICPVETVEDPRQVFGGDTFPGVGDLQDSVTLLPFERQVIVPLGLAYLIALSSRIITTCGKRIEPSGL